MPLIDFTTAYTGGPSFFTGTGTTDLVPHVFPVALNGRPYLVDLRSGRFAHQYEQRVRDQSDTSTAPGEASINPQGLWRRGAKSWHLGAGQFYGDDADAQDFRFYKSKGVNPWTKGQLSLLNSTKLSLSSTATAQHMVVRDGYVIVSVNGDIKYTSDPFASSPTWTDATNEPAGTCAAMATDGDAVYVAYPSDGVRKIVFNAAPTAWSVDTSRFVIGTDSYYMLGFAKGYMWGAHDHKLRNIDSSGGTADKITPADTAFRWVGVATGQSAVFAAGYAGKKSLIYKVTIQSNGTLDTGSVALELPTGEIVSAISGYLGFILLGTNKGVRFCTVDSQSNLIAGPLIPTTNSVKKFASNDRFVYFTYTNYDNSAGLGRLDLSRFTQANAPAYATDLMYNSVDGGGNPISTTADVTNVVVFNDKLVYMVSGIGVVVEDTANLVTSGTLETGYYTWGIPDKKFVPRFDMRFTPLVGTVSLQVSYDRDAYEVSGSHNLAGDTEHTFLTPQDQLIEAGYKLTLTRATATTGPTLTRWMSRAYAAPRRSQIITLPVILHETLRVGERDFFLDVELERRLLESLVDNPRIVTYQERETTYSVIVEDVEWMPLDTSRFEPVWEGTCIITMRTVAE